MTGFEEALRLARDTADMAWRTYSLFLEASGARPDQIADARERHEIHALRLEAAVGKAAVAENMRDGATLQ